VRPSDSLTPSRRLRLVIAHSIRAGALPPAIRNSDEIPDTGFDGDRHDLASSQFYGQFGDTS
jgi:hypothetical protein